MKRLLPALGALALWAAPPAQAEPPSGGVRSVRRDLVYVDLGRVHGVVAGDVLAVVGSPVRLEVVFLGEKQLAAKRIGTGDVPVGAVVASPREPALAQTRRPVVQLTPPRTEATTLPWSGDPMHRATLVASPPLSVTRRSGVRGDLRVGYVGLLDDSPSDLDLHQVEVRNTLALDLGGGLDYRHDVAARLELGPALDERSGSDSRPVYRIRELELRWRSAGWGDSVDEREAGAFEGALGRMHLWQSPSTGLLDGVRADLGLGGGITAGLYGGLVPALFDVAPSTELAVVGGHATWVGGRPGDEWTARASITTATSFWHGAMNRLDLGANGGLAMDRDLDIYAQVIATLVDSSLLPDAQSTFSLSRAYVGTRVRPTEWLTVDAHFAHEQPVADRETLSLLGVDRLVIEPRESTWLQVRFDVIRDVSLALGGTLGFGNASATYQGADARLDLRHVLVRDLRVTLAYRLGLGPATDIHHPSLDLALPIGRTVELGLGYGFTTFRSRLLDERQDEHRVDAGLDLLVVGPWRVHLRGTYAFGTLPSQVGIVSQLVWRFR